jgi:hypothetical protein
MKQRTGHGKRGWLLSVAFAGTFPVSSIAKTSDFGTLLTTDY